MSSPRTTAEALSLYLARSAAACGLVAVILLPFVVVFGVASAGTSSYPDYLAAGFLLALGGAFFAWLAAVAVSVITEHKGPARDAAGNAKRVDVRSKSRID